MINLQQFTACLPAFPCMPDPTPNPAATVNNSGAVGNVFLGYNFPLFNVANIPVITGVEGFVGFGSNSSTIRGIPAPAG